MSDQTALIDVQQVSYTYPGQPITGAARAEFAGAAGRVLGRGRTQRQRQIDARYGTAVVCCCLIVGVS